MSKVSVDDVEAAARVMAAAEVPDGHSPKSVRTLVDLCWRDFEETARAALEAVSSIHEANPVAWRFDRLTDAGKPFSSSLRFYKEPESPTLKVTELFEHPTPISKGVTDDD